MQNIMSFPNTSQQILSKESPIYILHNFSYNIQCKQMDIETAVGGLFIL